MNNLKRTTSDDSHFQALVTLLDEDLAIRDGSEHTFYAQFNKLNSIKNAVVSYLDDKPIGCGAFKKYDSQTVEIKRMFVLPDYRGQRIAVDILQEQEQWAAELNYTSSVLETGKKQPEAIRLYERSGYILIPNYGQYEGIENSVCMKKVL